MGTIVERLMNMQQELLSIEAQCVREHQIIWPLVPISHEVTQALDEYRAKAYGRQPEPKPERGLIE